mmetsp:Transcript_2403/g.6029  ORF Transcript_2403/g.6029 Transcript_2403/m.6029 type:complete len:232 (-) Transcript_2403:516-1211(-)
MVRFHGKRPRASAAFRAAPLNAGASGSNAELSARRAWPRSPPRCRTELPRGLPPLPAIHPRRLRLVGYVVVRLRSSRGRRRRAVAAAKEARRRAGAPSGTNTFEACFVMVGLNVQERVLDRACPPGGCLATAVGWQRNARVVLTSAVVAARPKCGRRWQDVGRSVADGPAGRLLRALAVEFIARMRRRRRRGSVGANSRGVCAFCASGALPWQRRVLGRVGRKLGCPLEGQ